MAKENKEKYSDIPLEVDNSAITGDCSESLSPKKEKTKVNKRHQITLEIPSLPAVDIPFGKFDATETIDDLVRQNTIDSDRDYRRITEKIIDKTCDQLKEHTTAKLPLRKKLSNFIIFLLIFQFVVLVAVLFLNQAWCLDISDFIINIYIVSVFVETLAGLFIMIRFAFESKQEVELISILNAIITNFKKYEDK